MAVPNMQHVVERVDRNDPSLIRNPHAFTARVCAALHAADARFGLNGKRGNPHDTSEDCTAALDADSPLVGSDGRRIRIIDFVIGAGGDNPQPGWIDQTDETIRLRTTGVWVQPSGVPPAPPVTVPPKDNPQPAPSTDLSAIKSQLATILEQQQFIIGALGGLSKPADASVYDLIDKTLINVHVDRIVKDLDRIIQKVGA